MAGIGIYIVKCIRFTTNQEPTSGSQLGRTQPVDWRELFHSCTWNAECSTENEADGQNTKAACGGWPKSHRKRPNPRLGSLAVCPRPPLPNKKWEYLFLHSTDTWNLVLYWQMQICKQSGGYRSFMRPKIHKTRFYKFLMRLTRQTWKSQHSCCYSRCEKQITIHPDEWQSHSHCPNLHDLYRRSQYSV